MSGYIRREDAMKAACEALCKPGILCPDFLCKEVREKFDAIPAADVRPVQRGRWIKHNATHVQKGGMYLECSCCHEYITVLGHVFAYCPNCGADMRGEEA